MLRASAPETLVPALRAATVCERIRAIDQLLAKSVDVNAKINGGTSLHWAAWQANADSIEHLLSCGADPTQRDDDHNMTPGERYLYRRTQLLAIGNPNCGHDKDRIERAFPGLARDRAGGRRLG